MQKMTLALQNSIFKKSNVSIRIDLEKPIHVSCFNKILPKVYEENWRQLFNESNALAKKRLESF